MIKIGIIGEDPNDTKSIQNLLSKRFSKLITFKALIRNKKGYQLNNTRVKVALQIEFERYKPQYVLFIRDADGIITNKDKLRAAHNWFLSLNKVVQNKGLFLLNIYELEALVLADIETFNKLYGTSIKYPKDVMFKEEPKEFLMQKTEKNKKSYKEADCPEIFEKLNYNTLLANCKYFKEFDSIFCKTLKLK
jgi:hypothetical protein